VNTYPANPPNIDLTITKPVAEQLALDISEEMNARIAADNVLRADIDEIVLSGHNSLTGRDADNCHPQSAIISLVSDLASKAPIANPTFTGTVSGINKAMVGLSDVDNTSDASKPVSTATQTALNLKANLASPALTGTPTTPTASAGTNTTQIASTAFVRSAIYAYAIPIGVVYFQGPNDIAPATLYPGTTWTNVSWEEANMTRRTAGDLAGARFTGVPAHLAVSVTGGVPTVSITNGGSGYLSGGSGTITLTLVGTCSAQAKRTATVTSGVVTAINVVAAGAGYTSGKIAIYDGVVGHGDLTQGHYHNVEAPSTIYNTLATGASFGGKLPADRATSNPYTATNPITDGTNGIHRYGSETSGAWTTVIKWRRTA
jgi:hypothetical protein